VVEDSQKSTPPQVLWLLGTSYASARKSWALPATHRDSTIYATALSLTRYNAGIPRVWIFDHSRLIRVYSLIGGLLDQLNEMAQDHRRWRSLGAVDTGESGFVLAKLHEMQGGLSNGLHDLQENVGQVLEKIDKYLDR
jgi:hypothetical protein